MGSRKDFKKITSCGSAPPIWLIGSGASKDAGLPLTGEIDKIVFQESFFRHTNGSYIRGDNPSKAIGQGEAVFPRVRALLRWARAVVGKSRPGGFGNYEEIFFLLQQIRDADWGEYENPALQPMVEKARDFLLTLDSIFAPPFWSDGSLIELTGEACRFIADAVAYALSQPRKDLEVLSALVSCIEDSKGAGHQVVVGTLNHDVLIDDVLKNRGISFCDGFDEEGSGDYRRRFNRSLLKNSGDSAIILKLHGSTKWVIIQEPDGGQVFSEVVDWAKFDEERVRKPGLDVVDGQPRILIGTHNKILSYSRPLFWHLFVRFRTSLERNNRLVVVGYGFMDKGINEILIDWMEEDSAHQMVVVDPFVKETKESCRPAIQRGWKRWVEQERLHEVRSKFKDATWADLSKLFNGQ